MTTALITGASRGLGLETARQLAAKGLRVYLGTRRAGASGEAFAGASGGAQWLSIDVADSASIRAAAGWLAEREPQLDVLINNAGVSIDGDERVTGVSRQALSDTFQVNTFGPIEVTQAFLPQLRASGAGRVLNVSSGCGHADRLTGELPSYALSKYALNGATRMLAETLKADAIAVNAVCPGWVQTDMGGSQAPSSVEEGASGIVWLATDAPQAATGKFFRDGQEIAW